MVKRWRRLLWVLMAVLCLAACAPAAALPGATTEPSVQPTATPAPVQPMILVLPGINQKSLIAVNRHYSNVARSKGWNIDFYTVQQTYDSEGTDNYPQYVAAQLASGVVKADGYFVYVYHRDGEEEPLAKAKADGLLYDCVAAAPTVVPDYWARWKDGISAANYGLPLCYEPSVAGWMPVFTMSPLIEEYAPKGVGGYGDIRSMMDRMEEANPGRYAIVANFIQWLDLWMQEQGYFSPDTQDGVCVRLDDPDAKPTLLEEIPGFEEFVLDYEALRSSGRILADKGLLQQRPIVGTLESVGYVVSPFMEHNAQGKFDISYPLLTGQKYSGNLFVAGIVNASQTSYKELVIPARSRRAEEAMAFVQWLYASPDNADCVIFGQLGEDFTLHDGRIQLSDQLFTSFTTSDANFYWPGHFFFTMIPGHLIPLNAPRNAENLRTSWPKQKLAAPWLAHMNDEDILNARVSGGLLGMAAVKRSVALSQLISALSEGAYVKSVDVENFLDMLRSAKKDEVLDAYTRLFEKLQSRE